MGYEATKKWRKKNPEKMRRYNKEYYAKTSYAEMHHQRWTEEETAQVMQHEKTDTELAADLKRSVKAIQLQRMRIKKSYP